MFSPQRNDSEANAKLEAASETTGSPLEEPATGDHEHAYSAFRTVVAPDIDAPLEEHASAFGKHFAPSNTSFTTSDERSPRREHNATDEIRPIPQNIERALISLTRQVHDLSVRLRALEARVEEIHESVQHGPSHGDLLEVRIHSAKLAAELARTTVELRGEIGMATDEARKAAIARSREHADELVIDLRDSVAATDTEVSSTEVTKPGPMAHAPERTNDAAM